MVLNDLKKDFPFLVANPKLTYLDNACTSIKPASVIDAEMSYYREFGACANRSAHTPARKTGEKAEACRENVAQFLGARAEELAWTKNATEALNIAIQGFDYSKSGKKKVVTSAMEHHAVLLPLLHLRDEGKIKLEVVKNEPDGTISKESWQKAIDRETALVVSHNSDNSSGARIDVRMLAKIAHDNGAAIAIDGAQGVPHGKTDFKSLDLDFLAFSGHKMLGPSGIGGLLMKRERMKDLRSLVLGGGTVKTVTFDKVVPMDDNTRFEAGVQHYSGIFGLSAACDYLAKIGMDKVEAHEHELARLIKSELERVGAKIFGSPSLDNHGALFSFGLIGAKAHDVALMLDREGIAVRSGFFCAQPAIEAMGAKDGAVRVSGYVYNTPEDVKTFGDALEKIGVVYG